MNQTSMAVTTASGVVAHRPHLHALPFYTVPDDALEMGASLGNSALWVNTKGAGAVERVFCVELGQSLLNMIAIRYAGPAHRPFGRSDDSERAGENDACVSYRQAAPGSFEIHPAYQRHCFPIAGFVQVTETTFVPLTGGDDPPVVYQAVELHNAGGYEQEVKVFGFARLRGTLADNVQARYDAELHALVAHNAGQPEAVRVYGVTETPNGYATSFDFGRVYDPLHVRMLDNSTAAHGDILGCLQVDVRLEVGETRRFAFITAISGQGETAAVDAYRHAGDYESALEGTLDCLS